MVLASGSSKTLGRSYFEDDDEDENEDDEDENEALRFHGIQKVAQQRFRRIGVWANREQKQRSRSGRQKKSLAKAQR